MLKTAIFSDDHKHRFLLKRIWDESKPICCFIMYNPSDADDKKDDPTVKRCINFAVNWGYGGIYVVNRNSFITSNPKKIENDMSKHCENIGMIKTVLNNQNIKMIICAWGNYKVNEETIEKIINYIKYCGLKPYCIKQNKNGSPAHPLYLKSDLKPIPFDITKLKRSNQ